MAACRSQRPRCRPRTAFALAGGACWLALSATSAVAESTMRIDGGPGGDEPCKALVAYSEKWGTAVLVQSDDGQLWVLTAYHVIDRVGAACLITRPGRPGIDILEVSDGPFRIVPRLDLAAVRVSAKGKDLLTKAGLKPAKLVAQAPKTSGRQVLMIGNPKIMLQGGRRVDIPYYHTVGVVAATPIAAEKLLPRTHLGPDAIKTQLLMINDFVVTEGFSGGPLFRPTDEHGIFLGMVQGGDPESGKYSWAIPADDIHQAVTQSCVDTAKCYEVAPFTDETVWPSRGFLDSLYAGATQDLVTIEAHRPAQPVFEVGEWTKIVFRVAVAGFESAQGAIRIEPDLPRDESVEWDGVSTSSELRDGFHEFPLRIRVTHRYADGSFTLRGRIQDNHRRVLSEFQVPGTVAASKSGHFAILVDAERRLGSPVQYFGRVALGFQGGADLTPQHRIVRAVEFGWASAWLERRAIGPAESRLLETGWLWGNGVHLQGTFGYEYQPVRSWGVRASTGLLLQLYSMDGALFARGGFPLLVGTSYQSGNHALRMRASISYCATSDQDIVYVNYDKTESVTARASFTFGLGVGYEYRM